MNDETERRHDYNAIADRLAHIETQMAVIHERTEDTRRLKQWLAGQVVAAVFVVVGLAVAWGDLHQKVGALSLDKMEQNITIALGVLKDHGTELEHVREEQLRLRTSHDDMQARFHRRITETADDRFRRKDFHSIFDPKMELIDERCKRIVSRLERVEREADYYFHGQGVLKQ